MKPHRWFDIWIYTTKYPTGIHKSLNVRFGPMVDSGPYAQEAAKAQKEAHERYRIEKDYPNWQPSQFDPGPLVLPRILITPRHLQLSLEVLYGRRFGLRFQGHYAPKKITNLEARLNPNNA